jgi:SAM-dependent methyltransferase
VALGGGPRRLVLRHERVAGQGRGQRRHLGLPPRLLSTSLLGWAAIAEVAEALRLFPGDTVLDVACGRGGYGLEIAARTGARLVLVDFSAEAVRQAREHAWRLGRTAGLPPRESRRDRPGRRLGRRRAMRGRDPVLPAARCRLLRATAGPWARRTCGADLLGALGQGDVRLPGRLWRVGLAARLTAVGVSDMEVRGRLGWRACERAMWQEAAALGPRRRPCAAVIP